MSKAIGSGMSNIAEYLGVSLSTSDKIPIPKHKLEKFYEMESLLINIRRDYKNFDLNSWLICNDLKGKTEREIFISLSEQYNKNIIRNKKCLNSIDKLSPLIKEKLSNDNYPTDSLSDFFHEVKQSIIIGKNDYLDVFKSIFSNYMDYVRELRTAITSLSKYTKAGKKDGYIAVNFIEFTRVLESFKNEYNRKNKEKLFFNTKFFFEYQYDGSYIRQLNNHKINYSNKKQVDHALNAISKLLMDVKGIIPAKRENLLSEWNNIDVDFFYYISLNELNKILDIVNDKISKEKEMTNDEIESKRESFINEYVNEYPKIVSNIFNIDKKTILKQAEFYANENIEKLKKERDEKRFKNVLQTEFDLFKKSLDALEKKINTNLDELSKKYSSANSNYDNFVKIVSSTINALLEMAKGFLRF